MARTPRLPRILGLTLGLAGTVFSQAGLAGSTVEVPDSLYTVVAEEVGVDPTLLRAIAVAESNENPFALNIDGASAFCESRTEAVRGVRYVLERPWVLPMPAGSAPRLLDVPKGRVHCALRGPGNDRAWFSAKRDALEFARTHGIDSTPRKITRASIDIGIAQINWYYHGQKIPSSGFLFDPAYNLRYAARFLKRLLRSHSLHEAVGRYTGGPRARRDAYANRVLRIRDRIAPATRKLAERSTAGEN